MFSVWKRGFSWAQSLTLKPLNLFVSDQVSFTTMIRHSNTSQAEGFPGIVRVSLPAYLSFTPNNSFVTNYNTTFTGTQVTLGGNLTADGSYIHHVDFFFNAGITFPDEIELNFTLTVKSVTAGSGSEAPVVVLRPICQQNLVEGYPLLPAPDNGKQCGENVQVPVLFKSVGKYNGIIKIARWLTTFSRAVNSHCRKIFANFEIDQ